MLFAEYYARQGKFDETRSVFEEALQMVANKKDFGIVFDAYLKFEEELLGTLYLAPSEGQDNI